MRRLALLVLLAPAVAAAGLFLASNWTSAIAAVGAQGTVPRPRSSTRATIDVAPEREATARLVVATSATATAPACADKAEPAYGWPVKPFDRQHPVRGFFGDPRVGGHPMGSSRQFHFGVDVAAPDGTAVYATASGAVSIHALHPDVVLITTAAGVEFSYWHILPTVRGGSRAVAGRTRIGRIAPGWGHVHFSERRGGRYVNPLRPGAMGPFADCGDPTVRAIQVERAGRIVAVAGVSGRVDLVADVRDATPLAIPELRWRNMPVMPAVVRWRLVGSGGPITPWAAAIDFRDGIPSAGAFAEVYARWSRQNRPNRPGRYRIYLARGWSSESVADGRYTLEVEAADMRGNASRLAVRLTVANHAA
jgi:hypothetical protein